MPAGAWNGSGTVGRNASICGKPSSSPWRHLWVDGGFILHWYHDRSLLAEGLPPLGFELIPLERLERGLFGRAGKGGNTVVDGIEYEGHSPVALHIMEEPLPGTLGVSPQSLRIPLTACRIVMVRDSIGQTVPISWLAATIMTLHNLGEYMDAEPGQGPAAGGLRLFHHHHAGLCRRRKRL